MHIGACQVLTGIFLCCLPLSVNIMSYINRFPNIDQRRRQWHPTPVLLPGKSHGRRSLVGCSPQGHQESGTTERLHFHALEKEMATHSSVLAWRIPGTGSLVGCHLWGRTESDTTDTTQQQQQWRLEHSSYDTTVSWSHSHLILRTLQGRCLILFLFYIPLLYVQFLT